MVDVSENMVVVKKVQLDGLIDRLNRLEKIVASSQEDSLFQGRVNELANGGMLETAAICELMGWSRRTFSRRLNAGEIPIVQDGRKYKMSVKDFIKWHHENYEI